MSQFFEIYGTRIPFSSIKDFRIIKVEFIFRPVFRESKALMFAAFSNKKYEFSHMEPYAAIIGQQGQKSELGEYKAKDFKEALGKDLSGGVIYSIADKFKLKAFKQQKYQCVNLAGRAFTTYLDDVPAKMIWNDGRVAEVYKEDKLHVMLNEITTPGIEYITALVVKANENYCFYGNRIQIEDASISFDKLSREHEQYLNDKKNNRFNGIKNISLPSLSLFKSTEKQPPETVDDNTSETTEGNI